MWGKNKGCTLLRLVSGWGKDINGKLIQLVSGGIKTSGVKTRAETI